MILAGEICRYPVTRPHGHEDTSGEREGRVDRGGVLERVPPSSCLRGKSSAGGGSSQPPTAAGGGRIEARQQLA